MLQGTWYVLLQGTQAYSGVTLTAHYAVFDTAVTLANGVPVNNLSGIAGTQKYFKIDVPAGQSKLEIDLSGGTGDADLYVRLGALPTVVTYDYKPNVQGNNETVQIDKPTAGTYYIMVRGNQSFSGVTLLATYGGPAPSTVTVLQNGVAVTGLAGATSSQTFFSITVPAGQAKLDIVMSGGTGDADLYVHRARSPPSPTGTTGRT